MELQDVDINRFLLVGRKLQLQGLHPAAAYVQASVLPMAATGSGGLLPSPPPSRRQDVWGVMIAYVWIYTGVSR